MAATEHESAAGTHAPEAECDQQGGPVSRRAHLPCAGSGASHTGGRRAGGRAHGSEGHDSGNRRGWLPQGSCDRNWPGPARALPRGRCRRRGPAGRSGSLHRGRTRSSRPRSTARAGRAATSARPGRAAASLLVASRECKGNRTERADDRTAARADRWSERKNDRAQRLAACSGPGLAVVVARRTLAHRRCDPHRAPGHRSHVLAARRQTSAVLLVVTLGGP